MKPRRNLKVRRQISVAMVVLLAMASPWLHSRADLPRPCPTRALMQRSCSITTALRAMTCRHGCVRALPLPRSIRSSQGRNQKMGRAVARPSQLKGPPLFLHVITPQFKTQIKHKEHQKNGSIFCALPSKRSTALPINLAPAAPPRPANNCWYSHPQSYKSRLHWRILHTEQPLRGQPCHRPLLPHHQVKLIPLCGR